MGFSLLTVAIICLPAGPFSRTLLGVVTTLFVIWLLAWWNLGKGTYLMDPLGVDHAFEPHLKRYQDLAKLIVTLGTASIAFLLGFLVNHPIDVKSPNTYSAALTDAIPIAVCCLCSSVFLLLVFMLLQTYVYETYCHSEKRNVYKGWLYAIQVAIGWTGFLTFLYAYGYLAFKVVRKA